MIPGIAIEEVDGDETVAGFDVANELPLGLDVGPERFFCEDVLAIGQRLANLLGTGIGERKQPDCVNGRIGKDGVGGVADSRLGNLFSG